jgi:hypothetical protein
VIADAPAMIMIGCLIAHLLEQIPTF